MKKVNFLYVLVLALLCVSLPSCDIGNDDEETDDDALSLSEETLSAKWVLSDNPIYESIEFNESGQYFIIEKAPAERSATNSAKTTPVKSTRSGGGSIIVYCGNYHIVDDIIIELSNYGTMEVIEITSNKLNAAIIKEGGEYRIDIKSGKQPQMDDSPRLNLLCRTWFIQSDDSEYVIFTKSGTFYDINIDGDALCGMWKWKAGETVLFMQYFSDANWESHADVTIEELTSTYFRGNASGSATVDGHTEMISEVMELFAVGKGGKVELPEPPKEPKEKDGPEDNDSIAISDHLLGIWECTFNIEFVKVNEETDQESIKLNTDVGTTCTFNIDGTFEKSHSFAGYWSYGNGKLTIIHDGGYPFEYSILVLNNERLEIECNMQLELGGSDQILAYKKNKYKRVAE